MSILRSALGRYESVEKLSGLGDVVIGLSYGTSTTRNSVNAELATIVGQLGVERFEMVDEVIYAAMLPDAKFSDTDETVYEIDSGVLDTESYKLPHLTQLKGPISTILGHGLGTYGTLQLAKELMDEYELNSPVLVGQAYHVGRAALQAQKLGMTPIIPAGLPKRFDKMSKQLWTKSLAFWIPYELAASVELKRRGQL